MQIERCEATFAKFDVQKEINSAKHITFLKKENMFFEIGPNQKLNFLPLQIESQTVIFWSRFQQMSTNNRLKTFSQKVKIKNSTITTHSVSVLFLKAGLWYFLLIFPTLESKNKLKTRNSSKDFLREKCAALLSFDDSLFQKVALKLLPLLL